MENSEFSHCTKSQVSCKTRIKNQYKLLNRLNRGMKNEILSNHHQYFKKTA
jgi:hypothetical protein